MSTSANNQTPTQTRRKRAPVACTECRRRHVRVRCFAMNPVLKRSPLPQCKVAIRDGAPCGRCATMSLTCTYSPTEAATNGTRPQSAHYSSDALSIQDPTSPLASPTERGDYYAFVPGQSPYTADEVYLVPSPLRGDNGGRHQSGHATSHVPQWSQPSPAAQHAHSAYPVHRPSPPVRSPQEPARPWVAHPSTALMHHHHPAKNYHHPATHAYFEPKLEPHATIISAPHQRVNEGWHASYDHLGEYVFSLYWA
jgi:hypothetical protein